MSGECLVTLEGHTGAVRALEVVGCRLYSGSEDGTILEWALTEDPSPPGEAGWLRRFGGHHLGVYALHEHDGMLLSGSMDQSALRWNLERGVVVQVREQPRTLPANPDESLT